MSFIRAYKKWLLAGLVIVILGAVFIIVSCLALSPAFVFRLLTHLDSSVKDYSFFPFEIVSKSETAYEYGYDLNPGLAGLRVTYKTAAGKENVKALRELIESTESASFIVITNDKIVYEQYANGYTRDSVNTSFSMAKSIDSLLIGKAIEDGYIESENQSIADYIDEFKGTNMERITIRQLLTMRSDISYEETGFLWFRDDAYTYWSPDLRALALRHTELTNEYQGRMHYNNYHPLLLGIILERSTDMSVSAYFEKSLWKAIGSEYDASWSLDSEKTRFEKMESGVNFRSIDFIKIGSMLLRDGYWNGQQIINSDWIQKSTIVDFPINEAEYVGTFLEGKNIGYGYMWYSRPSRAGGTDFWAWGKYEQILYVSPANNTVILRTGSAGGDVSNWPEVLESVALAAGKR